MVKIQVEMSFEIIGTLDFLVPPRVGERIYLGIPSQPLSKKVVDVIHHPVNKSMNPLNVPHITIIVE